MLLTAADSAPSTSAASPSGVRPRRRRVPGPLARKGTKLLRRVHLYSGLFLVPFVVLYGVTGYLFNHPEAFSDSERRAVEPSLLAEVGPAPRSATVLAGEMAAALNAEGATRFAVVDGSAELRGRYVFRRRDDDRLSSLVLNADCTEGELVVRRISAQRSPDRTHRDVGRQAAEAQLDLMKGIANRLFDRLEVAGRGLSVRSAPDVEFVLEEGAQRKLAARLDLRSGEFDLAESDDEAREELTVRRFLTRLHSTHTYPDELGARWWWSLLVDVMAAAMALWGLTGLVMWWQIKSLRRLGVAILVLSAASAAYLALGMHTHLTT